jgi:hypothetical protein
VPGRAGRDQQLTQEVGDRHRLRIEAATPIVSGDDSLPADELVVLARERGGSVRLTAHLISNPLSQKTRAGSFLLP